MVCMIPLRCTSMDTCIQSALSENAKNILYSQTTPAKKVCLYSICCGDELVVCSVHNTVTPVLRATQK